VLLPGRSDVFLASHPTYPHPIIFRLHAAHAHFASHDASDATVRDPTKQSCVTASDVTCQSKDAKMSGTGSLHFVPDDGNAGDGMSVSKRILDLNQGNDDINDDDFEDTDDDYDNNGTHS
jgi:hypothetical protein